MASAGFFRANAPWLAAGGLLTFGSSFGQTYFISIFAGEIRSEFGLSHGAWGSLYALGTFVSAALMFLVGGIVDGYRTRSLATLILIIFSAVCIAMALTPTAWLLPVVIFGLRFCGQGMMVHLSIVSVGRWFAVARGKAISITSIGFSIGEAIMPLIFVSLMGFLGWRGSWIIAACVLLVYIPILRLLLRSERSPRGQAEAQEGAGMFGRHWTRREALNHWLFWACVPGLLAQPIFGTAFFFQQVHLTEQKGWALDSFAALFPVYTTVSVTALLIAGGLVDRFGSGRIMPFVLLPMAAGFTAVSLGSSLMSAAVGMALLGMTQGMGAAVMGAFWPEYYGTRNLGSIRSVATSLMVFATALGPAATGLLIDRGIAYEHQLMGMAGICLLSAVAFGVAMARTRGSLV